MHPDIATFIYSLNKAGIGAGLPVSPQADNTIACNYRNNPDGTIRWVWPKSARRADFLKFYHSSGLRAGLFCFIAGLLADIGLLKLLAHGEFAVELEDHFFRRIANTCHTRWAWFSGTVGPNRKSILWRGDRKADNAVFIKIPLTERAQDNLKVEANQLGLWRHQAMDNVVLPRFKNMGDGCLRLADVGKDTRRTNTFAQLPFVAVEEWLQTGMEQLNYPESDFAMNLEKGLFMLQNVRDVRIPRSVLNKLALLQKDDYKPASMLSTTVHGDFTPWNVMVKNDKLHCIDLELGRRQIPVLFDLFHFVYQSNILIGNKGYGAIRAELDELFAMPQWQQFIKLHKIDITIAERLYLQYTVIYYLEVYQQQPVWHRQVLWLLKTWNEALSWFLRGDPDIEVRKTVLNDLSLIMKDKPHAVLKWMYQGMDSLPQAADMDICISRTDAKILIQELNRHVMVKKIGIRNKSFMIQIEIILINGELLYLDLINTFKRKSLVFMDAAKLLDHARENKYGLMVPSPADDFTYTWLFYWLNHSDIPDRYRFFLQGFNKKDEAKLNALLYNNYTLPVYDYRDVFYQNKELKDTLMKNITIRKENKGLRGLYSRLQYCVDSAMNLFPQKGFIITFSGVDGAGKSTVIDNIRKVIDKQLRRKVVVIRHRPGLLPILSAWKHGKQKAEGMAATRLPRQGKNDSKWSSRLRFGYYYLDYLFGQFYVQLRYVSLGYIVLYDRYYFDFISDAKRSNINLSSSFTTWWYRFLLKPQLNIFLFAGAELILQRKQELDAATIGTLTQKYLALFERLKSKSSKALYIHIENNHLDDTLDIIFKHIKTLHYENTI